MSRTDRELARGTGLRCAAAAARFSAPARSTPCARAGSPRASPVGPEQIKQAWPPSSTRPATPARLLPGRHLQPLRRRPGANAPTQHRRATTFPSDECGRTRRLLLAVLVLEVAPRFDAGALGLPREPLLVLRRAEVGDGGAAGSSDGSLRHAKYPAFPAAPHHWGSLARGARRTGPPPYRVRVAACSRPGTMAAWAPATLPPVKGRSCAAPERASRRWSPPDTRPRPHLTRKRRTEHADAPGPPLRAMRGMGEGRAIRFFG